MSAPDFILKEMRHWVMGWVVPIWNTICNDYSCLCDCSICLLTFLVCFLVYKQQARSKKFFCFLSSTSQHYSQSIIPIVPPYCPLMREALLISLQLM
uniref:Uncharacterized protein n=1 Tax=Nelumbo nucifera TaxID=4432 RepID=A0A822ZNN6_NELNU|nr:TPA_asm: hypothetical protein HUJ06_003209 [Nelumbo nucifera]